MYYKYLSYGIISYQDFISPIRGVASFARSGGQNLNQGGKGEGFFWPKSQIFRPKTGDLQKKKSSPKSEGFLGDLLKKKKKVFAEIRRLFFRPKTGDLQKKKGLRRIPKAFSGRNHKF